MKYVLYGLQCAGKTSLLSKLNIPVIHGSMELNRMASGKFSDLSDEEKNKLRIEYTKQLSDRDDTFISDGHYSFLDKVVFTDSDGNLYDVFIYCYCKPEQIKERLQVSSKNHRFTELSLERIKKWQNFEIENLRSECHKRNKDFYVVHDITSADLQGFIENIESEYSSYHIAEKISESIMSIYPKPCELHICDGDKTIIKQDSFRVCTNNYVTHAFDGNFYTGYQSMLFSTEVQNVEYDISKLSEISLNKRIHNIITDKNYIILSSGITVLWKKLAVQFGLKNVIADTLISADTKYFVVKILQDKGYNIVAYGDSKNDYYMLKKADRGYLYIGPYLSHSLENTDMSGIKMIYDKSPYILTDTTDITDSVKKDIEICKSSSGINGSRLVESHTRLGRTLGKSLQKFIPNLGTSIIVLERGGRFFGNGVYESFDGVFFPYDPKTDDLPDIHSNIVVIVDSVINTGKSILDTICKLKQKVRNIEIFIVTNVIQEKAIELLKDYKIFAVRTSSNSFIGKRQNEQKDGNGPDTADRLFNYIN